MKLSQRFPIYPIIAAVLLGLLVGSIAQGQSVGSWKIDDYLTFTANTHNATTGAATDADSVPAYRIYEDETGTPIVTGSMALLDDAGTTGYYSERVQLTAASGFDKGKSYNIHISAAVGSTTGTTNRTFQIEAEVDCETISDTGGGLTAVPWNVVWDAETQSEVADALAAYGASTLSVTDNIGFNLADITGGPISISTFFNDSMTVATFRNNVRYVLESTIEGDPNVGSIAERLATMDDAYTAAKAAALADLLDGGRLDLLINLIKTKTDNLPADPANDYEITGANGWIFHTYIRTSGVQLTHYSTTSTE